MNLKKLVNRHVRTLRAYKAENISCPVKLDANESPYGLKLLRTVETNRYPDPEAVLLRKQAARVFGVAAENILHGNGSDELISCLITAFGGPVLYPEPTFTMYGIIAQALGQQKTGIPLDEHFDLDVDRMLRASLRERPKIIFLSSPNNPTGNCFSEDRILKIVKRSRSLVVVDEAYHDFSGRKGVLPLLQNYPNLIVLRTLSKVGFAALRVGFMAAHPDVVNEVNKVRLPFNLNALSQKAAVEGMKNKKLMRTALRSVIAERRKLFRALNSIEGASPYPSDANFILFRVNDPDRVHRGLIRKGVLIRNMSGAVSGCLRVTVGTPRENRIFIARLKESVSPGKTSRRRPAGKAGQ